MEQDSKHGATAGALPRQFAIGVGVAVLLPLVVWYGARLLHPPPDSKAYSRSLSEAKSTQEREHLDQEYEDAQRSYYRDMFWVAYPVGLLALVGGTLLPVKAVGTGFMFGGLFTLAEGCFSYWDRMGDWLRFGSAALALVALVGLGYWKFRPGRPAGGQGQDKGRREG